MMHSDFVSISNCFHKCLHNLIVHALTSFKKLTQKFINFFFSRKKNMRLIILE